MKQLIMAETGFWPKARKHELRNPDDKILINKAELYN